jgi:hypothetical protein
MVPVMAGPGLGVTVECFALLWVPLFFTTAITILTAVITRSGGEALLVSYSSAVGLFFLVPLLLRPGASLPPFVRPYWHPYWALVDTVKHLGEGQEAGSDNVILCLLLYGSATFLIWLLSCAYFGRYRLRNG